MTTRWPGDEIQSMSPLSETRALGMGMASIAFRTMEGRTDQCEFLVNGHPAIFLSRVEVRRLSKSINDWLEPGDTP